MTRFLLGAGLSSVLLKYPNAFFDDSESQVCLFMVHTGVAKPVCGCTRMLSLLLPISEQSMLPVLMMFLFLNNNNNNNNKTTLKSENKLLVATLISLV